MASFSQILLGLATTMRFLYGDSVPFPPQYDFLGALKVFVDQSTIAARLDGEGRATLEVAEVEAANRARAIEALEASHLAAMHAIGTATTAGNRSSSTTRRKFKISHPRSSRKRKPTPSRRSRTRALIAKQKTESGAMQLHQCIDQIMVAFAFPFRRPDIVMELEGDQAEFQSVQRYPEGIATAYALSVEALDDWKKPRRVSEFASA